MSRQELGTADTGATLLDRAYQLGYFCAYRLMRTYWKVRRPETHGALVAIWSGGQVLLVRNSYVPYYSAPGGYLHAGESARDAAQRELREEVHIDADRGQLQHALEVTHDWEGKRDHVQIFHLEVEQRPLVRIDHREVVAAAWFTPQEVLTLEVFPPLKRAILDKAKL